MALAYGQGRTWRKQVWCPSNSAGVSLLREERVTTLGPEPMVSSNLVDIPSGAWEARACHQGDRAYHHASLPATGMGDSSMVPYRGDTDRTMASGTVATMMRTATSAVFHTNESPRL